MLLIILPFNRDQAEQQGLKQILIAKAKYEMFAKHTTDEMFAKHTIVAVCLQLPRSMHLTPCLLTISEKQ